MSLLCIPSSGTSLNQEDCLWLLSSCFWTTSAIVARCLAVHSAYWSETQPASAEAHSAWEEISRACISTFPCWHSVFLKKKTELVSCKRRKRRELDPSCGLSWETWLFTVVWSLSCVLDVNPEDFHWLMQCHICCGNHNLLCHVWMFWHSKCRMGLVLAGVLLSWRSRFEKLGPVIWVDESLGAANNAGLHCESLCSGGPEGDVWWNRSTH